MYSCMRERNHRDHVPKVRLDATKHETLKFSLSSIELIQLERTIDSTIPYVQKAYLDSNNDRLFILADCNLYIYDGNGMYISKLSIGNGPGEVLQVSSFAVDPISEIIYVLDMARFINVYDYSGNFIKRTQLDEFYSSDIFSLDSNNLFLICNFVGKGEMFFVGRYEVPVNMIRERFVSISNSPYAISTNLMVQNSFFYKGNSVMFFNPNIFSLFQYKNESFVKIISLDLGNRKVPEDFAKRFYDHNRSAFRDEAKRRKYVPVLTYAFYYGGYYLIGIDDDSSSCYAINSSNFNEVYENKSLSSYFGLPEIPSLKFPPVGFQEDMILFGCDVSDFFDELTPGSTKTIEIANINKKVCIDDNPIILIIRQ